MQDSESRSLNDPRDDALRLRRSFAIAAAFTALLWLIRIVETGLGTHFGRYGIYPGQLQGFAGILWAPLIHSSFTHVFANTAPLLVLGTALLYGYPRSAKIVVPAVYFGTGLGVWLFAREAYHVGASGLAFGFMFFVFVIGAIRWDKRAITLAMVVFFLYGGMIWGVLPGKPNISFESHLIGALIGISLAVLLRNRDPRPPEKRYSWEQDDAAEAEPDDDDPGRPGPG
jgi:membrane associated rhomboid family serine protease